MRPALLLTALTLLACSVSPPRWYEADSSQAPRADLAWGVTVLLLDPLATDASTVDELHDQGKRAVCRIGAQEPEAMLQLCRDKGFDAVSFEMPDISASLRERADKLRLPVLTAPSGT